MNVFVIGGTGLISTGIVDQLVERNDIVTVFTRGNHDEDGGLPKEVTHVQGDRHDADALGTAVADADPDALIDMVCFSPETARESVEAVGPHVDQYVFCSTIDIYHRPPERNPITEDAARHPNVSDYGRNKADAEDVFMDAHERDEFAATVEHVRRRKGRPPHVRGRYVLSRPPACRKAHRRPRRRHLDLGAVPP